MTSKQQFHHLADGQPGVGDQYPHPKLSTFFLAFLARFIVQSASSAPAQMLLFCAVFMLMTLVIFVLYGTACQGAGSLGPRRRDLFYGGGLGVKLALTEQ